MVLFLLPSFWVIHTKLSSSGCIATLLFLVPNGVFSLASLPLLSLTCTMYCSYAFKLRHFQKVIDQVEINSNMLPWQRDVDCNTSKNYVLIKQRLNFHFEQVPFRSMQTRLRYRHDSQSCRYLRCMHALT